MKKRHDIYWEFVTTAYEYGMYDNLTQSEIDELATISENRTFRALITRYYKLKDKYYESKELRGVLSYYQIMRQTVVLMATYLEKQLVACRNLRVHAIVGGYLRTLLDKMEYHSNIYNWKFVNLIKAYPKLSDSELAKYCVVNKIIVTDDPTHNSDINWMTEMFQNVRECMKGPASVATAPITPRESIYAARWIEIYERQK